MLWASKAVGPVAGRTAQRIGGRDVTDREHPGVAGHPQFGRDAHESVARRAGPAATSRCSGRTRPIAQSTASAEAGGCPVLHCTGPLLISSQREPVGHDGAVAGVQPDARFVEPAPDRAPRPCGWCDGSARSPGKYRSTRLSGQVPAMLAALLTAAAPPPTTITDLAAARRSWAARRSAPTSSADCSVGPAPEAVGDTGRDDERVVVLGRGRPVVTLDRDRSVDEVDPGERAVHGSHAVEPAVPVEGDPVVAGPMVGAAEPPAELLAADQPGFDRDADDVGVPGEPIAVRTPLSPRPAMTTRFMPALSFGGHGTKRDTLSTTSRYPGRRSRLRASIIGMLAPRNMASIATAPTNSHHASAGAAATPNSARLNQKLNSPK